MGRVSHRLCPHKLLLVKLRSEVAGGEARRFTEHLTVLLHLCIYPLPVSLETPEPEPILLSHDFLLVVESLTLLVVVITLDLRLFNHVG